MARGSGSGGSTKSMGVLLSGGGESDLEDGGDLGKSERERRGQDETRADVRKRARRRDELQGRRFLGR